MNFLQKIKDDILDDQRQRGHRSEVLVNTRALVDLINAFEQLDTTFRIQHNYISDMVQIRLSNTVKAIYLNNLGDVHDIINIVMATLNPIIEEQNKFKQVVAYYGGNNDPL